MPKLTDLTAMTTLAADDLLLITDYSALKKYGLYSMRHNGGGC